MANSNLPQKIIKETQRLLSEPGSKAKGSSLDEDKEEDCLNALLFSTSDVFAKVLNAAIELGVFDIIAKVGSDAPLSATEIASQLPAKNPDAPSMLDRMLRLLATHSLLTYSSRTLEDGSVERLYGLTPTSKFFLTGNEDEGSVGPLSALTNHPATQSVWLHMKDVILEGGNLFEKVHGMSLFQYMEKDPKFRETYNKAITGVSTLIMNRVLETYKGFEGLSSLVDVGGGTGKILQMIISKYPSIEGINFDLPHVVKNAPPYPGIKHVGGDMFKSIPKGKAMMIKDICHGWGDDDCVKILKNCYEMLPEGGRVIIINPSLPEEIEEEPSKAAMYVSILDNTMLTQAAGKQRTIKEFEALCRKAGFTNFHVAISCGISTIMDSWK